MGLSNPTIASPASFYGTSAGTTAAANIALATINDAVLMPMPVIQRPVSLTTAKFQVGVQSGNMNIGIYRDNGDGTATRMGSTGSFATPASGARTQPFTATVTLVPGFRYYIAIWCDNTTATFRGTDSSGAQFTEFGLRIAAASGLTTSLTLGSTPNQKTFAVFAS